MVGAGVRQIADYHSFRTIPTPNLGSVLKGSDELGSGSQGVACTGAKRLFNYFVRPQ